MDLNELYTALFDELFVHQYIRGALSGFVLGTGAGLYGVLSNDKESMINKDLTTQLGESAKWITLLKTVPITQGVLGDYFHQALVESTLELPTQIFSFYTGLHAGKYFGNVGLQVGKYMGNASSQAGKYLGKGIDRLKK